MIAGALVLEPSVIIADEPVSNLDASVRGEILALLMKFRDELQISLMIVTHDLGLAWTVADRVAVMYLGRVVEIGPTAEVLLNPRHPYTKALLNVVPEAGGTDRPILQGEPPDPTRIPTGCRFHPALSGRRLGPGEGAWHRGSLQGHGPAAVRRFGRPPVGVLPDGAQRASVGTSATSSSIESIAGASAS